MMDSMPKFCAQTNSCQQQGWQKDIWQKVDVVLLDMDGTLIDLHFDNTLWNKAMPERFAVTHNIPQEQANKLLFDHMRQHAATPNFYCLDHWAEFTNLDIMGLHDETLELLCYRPGTLSFLRWLQSQPQRVVLTTNAHRKSVDFKHAHIGLLDYFDAVVSGHDYMHVKESEAFWQAFERAEGFDKSRTLFIDDNEAVLDAASDFGIGHLLSIATPDSQRPPRSSSAYPFIDDLSELITQ